MNKITLICASIAILAGCASTNSTSKSSASEAEADKVLSRIDDLPNRPAYIKESEPFRVEGGNVISLGQTTIPADNRVEAAYRIAENNAKGSIASAIEQRLEFVFQNAEEGTSIDATQARFIGAEASKLSTSSIRPGNRYWEKVSSTSDSGQRVTRIKVFTTVVMPEADFKKAILDAARRAQGKGGLSEDFAKKVDSHWDKFVENK